MESMKETETVFWLLEEAALCLRELDSIIETTNDLRVRNVCSLKLEDWGYLTNIEITPREVFNECWRSGSNVESLNKVADWLQVGADIIFEKFKDFNNEKLNSYLSLIEEMNNNDTLKPILPWGSRGDKLFNELCWQLKTIYKFVKDWRLNFEKIINDLRRQPQSDKKNDATKDQYNTFPKELDTEEAKKWLNMAVEGGLLDADYQPTEKTKTKALQALLAEILKELIGLENYKPFELLWSIKGIAKRRYNSRYAGKVKGEEEIYKVFPQSIIR